MYRLQYRNFGTHESLVVNHTVDSDGSDHAGIRWYEIRNPSTGALIYQQGTYAPDGDSRWLGSAAMDSAGKIALEFSVSGATTSPSIRYAGRLATDPAGILTQGESDLMVGSGSQTDKSGRSVAESSPGQLRRTRQDGEHETYALELNANGSRSPAPRRKMEWRHFSTGG